MLLSGRKQTYFGRAQLNISRALALLPCKGKKGEIYAFNIELTPFFHCMAD